MIRSQSFEALDITRNIDWNKYKSYTVGVRWHPSGSWRVQFNRRSYEHNFFVACSCFFRVHEHGFEKAKQLAVAYRRRLEKEWEELESTWATLDDKLKYDGQIIHSIKHAHVD